MKPIKKENLLKQKEIYLKGDKNVIIRHALNKNSIYQIVRNADDIKEKDFNFDINIKTMPATNQKASGRCWIFAAANIVREIIGQSCNLANFELSQSYLAFYDRLEKANYLLEAIIELIDQDYDDRVLTFLLQNGVSDGGQWDMFVSLVNKYGFVPKNVYPETATSGATRETRQLINFNIRKFASEAKALYHAHGLEVVREAKEKLLDKIYALLINAYGLIPETFDFEYTDKDNVYHLKKGFTPLSFKEKYLGNRLDDFVSIINAPTKDKPFNITYTIKYLGNVVGGKEILHLNVDMERMKQLIVTQLKDNCMVWFGSDVAFYGDREEGFWDDEAFDLESPFALALKMNKGEGLDYRASQMNHAMCITGVTIKSEKPIKWKIQNSWGSGRGKNGYYMMSGSWFDRFVYQAVIDKKYLNDSELKALIDEPVVLKPWDPMGSLAD
ncbi:MAG: C1 family peptidase [Erysipelotrichia bacterium]|nr:C1 family peptidase [Erysipelotrichia bacterium]